MRYVSVDLLDPLDAGRRLGSLHGATHLFYCAFQAGAGPAADYAKNVAANRDMLVNVTLLFSREHYLAAAAAYMRGIERRIAAGLDPDVASVASIFISRWDVAIKDKVPDALRNQLGIAIGMRTYQASGW